MELIPAQGYASVRKNRVFCWWRNMVVGILTASLTLICGCSRQHLFSATPDVKAIVAGNNAFALDLYHQLDKRQGNLAFSPFDAYTALAMTYAGARGRTATQMAKALHFTLPQPDVPPAFHQLLGWYGNLQGWDGIQLNLADSLWAKNGYRFKSAFLEVIHTNFDGEGRSLDFADAAEAADKINGWVEGKTGGKINWMVNPGEITSATRLFLCSAMYFDGKWRARFKVKNTHPMPFITFPSNKSVMVSMMFQFSKFKMVYGRVADDAHAIQILELPYSGEDISMTILLPMAFNLSSVEKNLTSANLEKWLAKLDRAKPDKVAVRLPRFKLQQNMNLATELKTLGISLLFNANADLSGMDGTTNLFVANAVHKAGIEVDEAGTRAMAATVVRTDTKGMPPQFMADTPFIFLIRDNQTGCILFMGRVVNPLKN